MTIEFLYLSFFIRTVDATYDSKNGGIKGDRHLILCMNDISIGSGIIILIGMSIVKLLF